MATLPTPPELSSPRPWHGLLTPQWPQHLLPELQRAVDSAEASRQTRTPLGLMNIRQLWELWVDQVPPSPIFLARATIERGASLSLPEPVRQVIPELTPSTLQELYQSLVVGYLGLARCLHVGINDQFPQLEGFENRERSADLQLPAEVLMIVNFYQALRIDEAPARTIGGSSIEWKLETSQDIAATHMKLGNRASAIQVLRNGIEGVRREATENPLSPGKQSGLAVATARLARIEQSISGLNTALDLEIQKSRVELNRGRLQTLARWALLGAMSLKYQGTPQERLQAVHLAREAQKMAKQTPEK